MTSTIPTRRVSHPFWIGLFAFIGFSFLVFFILWLGAARWFQEYQLYVTYFDTSVEGIEPGTAVKYQGIPVGRVKTVHLAPDGKLIEIVMELEADMQVDTTLRVKQALASIAGGKFLQLFYPESPEEYPPLPLQFQPPYPVIPSAPSDIETLELALNEVINNLRMIDTKGISEGTKRFLHSIANFVDNPELRTAIAQTAHITSQLRQLLERFDSTGVIEQLGRTGRSLSQTSARLSETIENLQQQITHLRLDQKADQIVARYDTVMVRLEQTILTLQQLSALTTERLLSTAAELERTSRELRLTLRTLREDFGPLMLTEPPDEEE